jgi:ABC-type branched-subunit amino acid transport system substrate-binding protein
MKVRDKRRVMVLVPIAASTALVLAACGSGGGSVAVAQHPAVAAPADRTPAVPITNPAVASAVSQSVAQAAPVPGAASAAHAVAAGGKAAPVAESGSSRGSRPTKLAVPKAALAPAKAGRVGAIAEAGTVVHPLDNVAQVAANQKTADARDGATDVGVTKDSIKLGAINMHGMALGNLMINPLARAIQATYASINDRGGVLGRRLVYVDCDDGPGEVSRTKACIKKLASVDKIFALLGGATWGSASVHDDLKLENLPYFSSWAYSQTEWQDPYMFPTHMSMIHEAMAGAHWTVNVIKPKTYGLICLTSPEMQLACNTVAKILDASGARMVKRVDVSIAEASMSAYVLAMRAANPEHIVHYVINPSTMAKFMVESAQQGYYPPKGISGNHMAAEVLGSIFGKWPAGRYWTNTTYKLWGPEYMAMMNRYVPGNRGLNHHITQADYVGANIFALAAKAVGPNLTRARVMAQLSNGDLYASDSSLDQRFSYAQSERIGDNWSTKAGQGREFMYKYTSENTVANPDGSPSGFTPDSDQFIVHTDE